MTSERQTLEEAEVPEKSARLPASEEEVEKSDVVIKPPLPHRSGVIQVLLKYGGRRKPILVDFPEDPTAEGVG